MDRKTYEHVSASEKTENKPCFQILVQKKPQKKTLIIFPCHDEWNLKTWAAVSDIFNCSCVKKGRWLVFNLAIFPKTSVDEHQESQIVFYGSLYLEPQPQACENQLRWMESSSNDGVINPH